MTSPLHIVTPDVESRALSEILGCEVRLKMEALQPTGSFKIRGVGLACTRARDAGIRSLWCSSGGNAGLAVAYAGFRLGLHVTVVVPRITSERRRGKIRRVGASVVEHGLEWDDAHVWAAEQARVSGAAYVHPFDDPLLWQGHGTLVDELFHGRSGKPPGIVVAAVGGGGLLCGILEGLDRVGWGKVPVVTVETEGAASFAASHRAGRLVSLHRIDSVATSLGARTVAEETLIRSADHEVIPWVVSDRRAIEAARRFLDDHRLLVEPACGAVLSAVYDRAEPLLKCDSAAVVVCGGAGVSEKDLREWTRT